MRWPAVVSSMVIVGVCAAPLGAQIRMIGNGIPIIPGAVAGQNGPFNLPYMTPDGAGGMWWVYNDGALRQQMGAAIYQLGGLLTVDGATFNVTNNQATADSKTGEVIFENHQVGNVEVTRRLSFDKDSGCVRYIDIFHNSTNQDRTLTIGLQTVLNWGVQQGQLITDAKHKDQHLGWVGMTNMGRAVLELYGGSGGKSLGNINYANGGNVIQTSFSLTVPAGKETALLHLHMFVPTVEAGNKFVADLKLAKLLHNVPAAMRREIVNFPGESGWLGDMEVLRGDLLDIVELRGGDQFKGTLADASYTLQTFHGPVELPADRVIAMMNAGWPRPRQLVVSDDGEIFGGHLAKQTLDIALTSGQTVSIPWDQISRVGYRMRAATSDAPAGDKPLLFMRGGDRMAVELAGGPIQVATRYGLLSLDAATVASIVFQSDESPVHEIYLTDGSKFAGLVCANELEMKLVGAGLQQRVRFPVTGMLRLQLSPGPAEAEAESPTLLLLNQDLLCGGLEGELKLQTAFDTITLEGEQIRHIGPGSQSGDSQVTLWDGSVITGQIVEPTVSCKLLSGAELNAPVSLLSEYDQPHPLPSPQMVKQIQDAAAELNADDWRQRDRAEAALTELGPAVIGVLRDLRAKGTPEAQQRIDAIIKKLDAHGGKAG